MAHGIEPEYKLVVSSRENQAAAAPTITEIGEVKPVGSISYADELNAEGDAGFSLNPDVLLQDIADRFANLRQFPCELGIIRNEDRIWTGPIINCQMQGPTLTVKARGLFYYTRYMRLEADLLYATPTDQFAIAAGLIDAYQSLAYGDYGLDLSGIGTSGVTRIKNYFYLENHVVYDRLRELAERDNGFDIWVDHATREVNLGTKGADLSQSVYADQSNITNPNVFWSVAAEDIFSDVISMGLDSAGAEAPVVGTAESTTVRESWGRATGFVTADGVVEQATIDDHAQRSIDQHDEQLFVPAPGVVPVKDGEPSDFTTGDTINYSIRLGNIGLVNVQRRVRLRRVTVSPDGTEDMQVEFI